MAKDAVWLSKSVYVLALELAEELARIEVDARMRRLNVEVVHEAGARAAERRRRRGA